MNFPQHAVRRSLAVRKSAPPPPPAQDRPRGSGLTYAELRQIVLEQLG